MKRPMLICGSGAMLFSIAFGLFPSHIALIASLSFIFVAGFAVFLRERKRVAYFLPLFVVLFLVSVLCFREYRFIEDASEFYGNKTVYGTVCEKDKTGDVVKYIVDVEAIDSIEVDFKINLISADGFQFSPGDTVKMKVEFSGDRAPTKAQLANGIRLVGKISEVYEVGSSEYSLYRMRDRIKAFISEKLNFREAGTIVGIMLGDGSAVSDSVRESFSSVGISHVLVVSGMHFSVLAGGIYIFLCRLKLKSRRVGIIGFLCVVFLMALTGFTVSVTRAGLAYLIMFSGFLINRRPDPVNSLFLAITIIIMENPLAIFSISFQLSSAATFGVIVMAPMLSTKRENRTQKRFFGSIYNHLTDTLLMSVSAGIMTMPIIVYNFGTISPIMLVSNLVIAPLSVVVLCLAAIAVLMMFMPPISIMMLLFAGIFTRIMIVAAEYLSGLPYANFAFFDRTIAVLIMTVMALGFVVLCYYRYDKIKKIKKEEQKIYADCNRK
ncbi:MAG: ComEC/Rec2 family competence protein [Clostridia bacterium]|nr:ComEC/Rec2 family competence protein [Clostridia bacterium]